MKFALTLTALVGALAPLASAQEMLSDIPTTAVDAGVFETLVAALGAADLVSALAAPGPFTVFAPTDDAFAALPEGLVSCLLEEDNSAALTSILTYHVVSGSVLSTDLTDGMMPATLQGEAVTIDLSSGVMVNQANVVTADVMASNGVIHVIDAVIVPPSIDVAAFMAASCMGDMEGDMDGDVDSDMEAVDIPSTAVAAGSFETLVAALDAAGLVSALAAPEGPFTVFAPTDDAFAALPEGLVSCLLEEDNSAALTSILTYHVVSGSVLSTDLTDGMMPATLQGEAVTIDLSSGVMVNQANVVTADVMASNGVIHVIDAVIVPPSIDVAAFMAASCMGDMEGDMDGDVDSDMEAVDIPSTAVAAGSFETLVAALDAAGLVSALAAPEGPFTVFAPTDDAFAALPEGLVSCLLEEDNSAALTSILTYHVVSGSVLSTDLTDGMMPATLQGEAVTIDLSSGVMVNQANVVTADVMASNGVIHVIDAVIVPPSIDVAAFMEASCTDTMVEGTGGEDSAVVATATGAMAAAAVALFAAM